VKRWAWLLLFSLLLAWPVYGQPQMQLTQMQLTQMQLTQMQLTQTQCAIVADMGLGSRAMAIEGIGQDSTKRIIEQWYMVGEQTRPITDAVIAKAYRDEREPLQFGRALIAACMTGTLGQFLDMGV